MDAVDGPLAILCEVVGDLVEMAECRCGVWVFDYLAELVEGGEPLIGLFVEEGNSVLELFGWMRRFGGSSTVLELLGRGWLSVVV
jgi:hypothetical protein